MDQLYGRSESSKAVFICCNFTNFSLISNNTEIQWLFKANWNRYRYHCEHQKISRVKLIYLLHEGIFLVNKLSSEIASQEKFLGGNLENERLNIGSDMS